MQSKTISEILGNGIPTAVGKIGFSEMKVLYAAQTSQRLTQIDLHDIFVGAGVFPPDETGISSFIEEMRVTLPEVDFLAKMGIDKHREDSVIDYFAKEAKTLQLRDLEPYYWDDPWSKQLKTKKVLIISPFTETMETQYKKREDLWQQSNFLPVMKLEYLKCPLSYYIKKSKYSSWIEGLNNLKEKMSDKYFDICLIGAGAWSLPLACHAKKLGKIGIHLGGPLQILFGIKGKRWDEHEVISSFYNENWVRPLSSENAENSTLVEGGCYW